MLTKGILAGWIRLVGVVVACGCMMTGCEESSDSSSATSFLFGDNDPRVVVAMGDSVTEGSAISGPSYPELVAQMSGKTVINEGRGGVLSSYGAGRIGGVLAAYRPGYVFILYGINDLTHGQSHVWTVENLRLMIRTARQNKTYPIVGTITPRYRTAGLFNPNHEALNMSIRSLCEEENVRMADVERAFANNPALLQPDGIHPNEDGNLVVAMAFYEAMH